ncbi:MAG: sodium/alanine symporter, partial [Duncaniella sp.]|nr:sodium/alanine symporter [Duncaniella sp.]
MINSIADFICGVPLFILLIGGGLFLLLRSGLVSLRSLPSSLRELRDKQIRDSPSQISSINDIQTVVAAT